MIQFFNSKVKVDNNKYSDDSVIVGKQILENAIEISSITIPEKNIVIQGCIFNQKVLTTKTGKNS